jgi:hypothetical protein
LSLSEEPLRATVDEAVLWNTSAGDLDWKAFEPSSIPARTAPARLRQMRGFVERFEIVLDDSRNNIRGNPEALRKLTRPLFRYDNVETGVIDGALFAFVKGTDPEAVLLVEARENLPAGKSWHYALARMNCDALSAKLDGTVVKRFANVRERKFDPRWPYSVMVWPEQPKGREPAAPIARESRP